jgi:hypothetical protein
MLVKRTRGNQVTLPKRILGEAGITQEKRYFDVECRQGTIILRPVCVEEDIPERAYEELLRWAGRTERGDKVFRSGTDAVKYLKNRVKPMRG